MTTSTAGSDFGRRAHVVGHSGGGVVATQLALDAPAVVHSLVVLEPAIVPPAQAPEMVARLAPAIEAYRSRGARAAVDLFMDVVSSGGEWRSAVSKTVPEGPEQAERDAATFFELELPAALGWTFDRERASRVRQPVLFVLGGASGATFEQIKENFVSLVPQAEVLTLPELDHLLFIRDAKPVASAIAGFLERHPIS